MNTTQIHFRMYKVQMAKEQVEYSMKVCVFVGLQNNGLCCTSLCVT